MAYYITISRELPMWTCRLLDRTQRRLTLPATCPHFPQGVRRSGEIQELGYILDAFKALANAWQTGSLPDSVFSVAIWAHRFLSRLGSLAQRPLHAPHHTVPIVTPPSVSSVRRRQGLARLRDIRLLCLCIRDPVLLGSSHHAFLGEKTTPAPLHVFVILQGYVANTGIRTSWRDTQRTDICHISIDRRS